MSTALTLRLVSMPSQSAITLFGGPALFVTVIVASKLPAVPGVHRTLMGTVWFCPTLEIDGGVGATSALDDENDALSGAMPVFLTLKLALPVLPTRTSPMSITVGVTSMPAAGAVALA